MPNPSKLDALLRGIAGQAPESKYIRAYHGSPYDWDKVDMSMVTKGEGPLDEGFGFYASASEGVGNWYRERTSYLRRKILADQLRQVRDGLRAEPNDPQWHAKYHSAVKLAPEVRRQRGSLQREFPRGRTYELEIAFPRDSLMEYDVPVYAQQPEVLEKMRSVNPQLTDDLVAAGLDATNPVPGLGGADRADGALFYHILAGGNVIDSPTLRGQRRASQMLFDAGIPGHAYRGNADNYVFYPGTEDSIRILRKYGVMAPIPMAAGAAGATMEE
jgi:hypothetical protein